MSSQSDCETMREQLDFSFVVVYRQFTFIFLQKGNQKYSFKQWILCINNTFYKHCTHVLIIIIHFNNANFIWFFVCSQIPNRFIHSLILQLYAWITHVFGYGLCVFRDVCGTRNYHLILITISVSVLSDSVSVHCPLDNFNIQTIRELITFTHQIQ